MRQAIYHYDRCDHTENNIGIDQIKVRTLPASDKKHPLVVLIKATLSKNINNFKKMYYIQIQLEQKCAGSKNAHTHIAI